MPNLSFMWDGREVKARTWISRAVSVHDGFWMDDNSRRCGGGFVRVRGWCFSAAGSLIPQGGRKGLSKCFSVVSLLSFGTNHDRLNCRPFLAVQFFWNRDVGHGAFRVSDVMRFDSAGFENCACSIDETVA